MNRWAFPILAGLLLAGGTARGADAAPWAFEQVAVLEGFDVPESVTVDPATGYYYVSNVETRTGGYWVKDGQGFLSRLKPDGSVARLRWRESLPRWAMHAPKGMCILQGNLYVADVDHVGVYSLATGRPVASYGISGAKQLNDIATDGRDVYVSDTVVGKIHRLDRTGRGSHRSIAAPKGVNGITFHGGKLFAVSWDLHEVYEVDLAGKDAPQAFGLAAHFTNLDGIEVLPDGTFVVSDFMGNKVCAISPDRRTVTPLLTLESPADIFWDEATRRLFVPQFMKDRVVIFKAKGGN